MSVLKVHTVYDISTHALTEGDFIHRHQLQCLVISTHALTEGDVDENDTTKKWNISTHALTEGDNARTAERDCRKHFNSRPHGGRLRRNRCIRTGHEISTHALTEGDHEIGSDLNPVGISTHALTEGDRDVNEFITAVSVISTHALTEGDVQVVSLPLQLRISTHALTEGDGKFRQIFLLNRGYAYSISLYFLPHFISLLPQILSFQQKSFKFQVRIFLLFSVHLAFALQNQCVHHVKSRFCTNMFYFVFVLFTQIVKSQTISLFIYDFF